MIYPFYVFSLLHVFFWKECLSRGITHISRISQERISTDIYKIPSATGAAILFGVSCVSKTNAIYSLWEYICTHVIRKEINQINMFFYSTFHGIIESSRLEKTFKII